MPRPAGPHVCQTVCPGAEAQLIVWDHAREGKRFATGMTELRAWGPEAIRPSPLHRPRDRKTRGKPVVYRTVFRGGGPGLWEGRP